ncbi:MAG: hypothetical protein UHN59_04215 [Bacteroidales bacterium]|nr:hypothetical protein [Bacteroidales bacterium]
MHDLGVFSPCKGLKSSKAEVKGQQVNETTRQQDYKICELCVFARDSSVQIREIRGVGFPISGIVSTG